ncbi:MULTISPECIES: DeoR/GlpR family DNA-binding transcription regulator [Curtobacterium]|uniref:DeoR/GlpR family DNA-binding transcription regulator n=1 Tax=Curtobacterium TaxID=2034 RepID=UPI001C8D179A|nr:MULTISPECIES: DeoR/GlpR family DNA-binding transcription regulator [Curtobacterium]MDY1003793.1 DeoR/GlpR family DNA-binding transcription regulator [Curtobacterium sp. CFBP9011]
MNARDRRREIGHLLQEKPVNVDELAAVFSVSASTIRRDLDAMTRDGDIVRTYGGARTIGGPERSLQERESIAIRQKAAIGRLASSFIDTGAVAVLDAGTTVGALARNLVYREGVTVVTNGLTTTTVLEHSTGIELIVVGGRLRHISSGFVGPFAERVMADVSADVAFLSADGVSASHGLCEETPEQASLKRVMVERARELYVLADASKLGVASSHWWTRIERPWSLVTDDGATDEQLAAFRASEFVTVHVAPTEPPELP